jgi:hypothetical protein
MKKLTLLLSILITLSFQAQQIPNGDFENWITQEWGEEPENWGEYFMQGFHEISPGLIDNTIVKSDDAYSGSYAMEIRSFTNTIFGETDTIVPMVILNLNNANSDSAFMLLDSGLIYISGYFKQDLADEDDNYTAIYVTAFYEGQQSGYGIIEFEEDIEDYTAFDIPIQYITSTLSDSIILMIFGGNQDNQLPGNTLLLDGLQFNYDSPCDTVIISIDVFEDDLVASSSSDGLTFLWNTGETTSTITPDSNGVYTVEATDPDGCSGSALFEVTTIISTSIVEDFQNSIKLFPNPANNNFKISSNEVISLVEITDLSGRVIYNSVINQNSLVLDTREFANNIFIVRCVINGNNVINKLVVTH